MKIIMINGSQKIGESNSGIILERLYELIKDKHDIKIYNSGKNNFENEIYMEIITSDIVILVFPLFVHSIPSNTLKMLIELENIIKEEKVKNFIMYAIINNGFYEGSQNNIAFEIINNWCKKTGIKFGGGIGQGAGEMIGRTKHLLPERNLFKKLTEELNIMAKKIESKETFDIKYINSNFPRFLWKFMAVRHWNNSAKKNGLNKKDIKNR